MRRSAVVVVPPASAGPAGPAGPAGRPVGGTRQALRGAVMLAPALVLLAASDANAAAYYVGDIGARTLARGGANIVNPGDPSAVWLNPAAITLSTGVQLQIDLNLVWLTSDFVRDCGGVDNGCAPLDDVERSYRNQAGEADPARAYAVVGGSRNVNADDPDNPGQTDVAEPNKLGNRDKPSRFDGQTNKVSNQAGVQPVPRMFATFNTDTFGIDGIAAGVYVFAPSAGDYQFGEDEFTRYTLIDRDLLEVYYGLTLAYRFQNWIAFGASLQGVTSGLNQNLRLTGDFTGNEDVNYDIQVRIQGEQHLIPSGNFGFWSNPLKPFGLGDLEIAGSLQLPRYVKTSGPITIEKFGEKFQAEFIDSGLAEIDDDNATAQAEFVLPPFYRLGIKYGVDDIFRDGTKMVGFNVEADFVYEQWSTYDHVFLTTQDLNTSIGGAEPEPLPPIVQPKDWQDSWSVRAGGTLALFDKMVELHGGGFYETGAIPSETYSVELVDGDKVGLGTGLSAKIAGVRLDVGYSHIFVFDRVVGQESIVFTGKVDNPVLDNGETRTRVAMGRYTAGYDMLNVGLTVAFDEMLGFGVHAPPAAPAEDRMPESMNPTTTTPPTPTDATPIDTSTTPATTPSATDATPPSLG